MKYIMMIVTALMFSACGSDSQTTETTPNVQEPTSSTVFMQTGKVYTVKKGDKLIKTTDEAVVNITKKTQEDTTEVVLVEGEAKIIFN